MGRESGRLDYWRRFFSSCNFDIFGVIENAILVAAVDCPREFLSRRDGIAERLFSCRASRCLGCDRVELRVPCGEEEAAGELEGRREGIGGGGEKAGGIVGGRGGGGGDDDDDDDDGAGDGGDGDYGGGGGQIVSNYNYDEAEALTEEIEEEGQTVGEVLRIKELLTDKESKSDAIVFESLRRLQLMDISVETLKSTEVGKVINGLRKHNAKHIRQIARTLIDGWKAMVEEWANSTAVLAEATPESANPPPSSDQWEGLPLPPLDEGALLATQTGTMELSQFFDGMDDDGNLGSSGDFNDATEDNENYMRKQQKSTAKAPEDKRPTRKLEATNVQTDESNSQNKQDKTQHRGAVTAPESQFKQLNGRTVGSGLATVRPPRPGNDQRIARDIRQSHPSTQVQRKPPAAKACAEDNSVREKLEIAKRKLHEGYRQAETAKRQRTIQVMELHDLPKQSLDNRQLHQRPISSRYWANRRV